LAAFGALLVAVCTATAEASSDQAWLEFKQAVGKACMAEARKVFDNPVAAVDALGSPSYGIALVSGRPKKSVSGNAPDDAIFSAVCVYNKKSKIAELSGFIKTHFGSP